LRIITSLLTLCILTAPFSLRAETLRAGVDFSLAAPSGWSVENHALWEISDSTLRMKAPGDSTGSWLMHFVRLDSAPIDGDFTVHATAGFSGAAYPMENDSAYSWKIYYRALAFGIMADSANALLATFCRTNGKLNGILRLKDGKEIWLCRPYSGQGVGLDVHDLREYRMTREGRKVIVWAGGVTAYMAEDTLAGPPLDGNPVVCGPGPVGLAVQRLAMADSGVASVEWPSAECSNFDFDFFVDITARATVENGSIKGASLGAWVNDGCWQGNHSWAAMGGQINVQNYVLGPNATIETWFKLVEAPEQGLPLVQLVFDGSTQDSAWSGRERGGPMVFHYPDSSLGLHFHEFGDITLDIPDVFHLNEWTHLAWVRQGKRHTIYVNNRTVVSFEMPRYGERALHGIQLTLGQNADHDWITTPGRVYALFDCLKSTQDALSPYSFLAPPREDTHSTKPNLFYLATNFPNPFSPSTCYKTLIPETCVRSDTHLEVRDIRGKLLRTLLRGELTPGDHESYWDGLDDSGQRVGSGMYFIVLQNSGKTLWKTRLVLLR